MKKIYILPLTLTIIGCFLVFFGNYELTTSIHFTGACTDSSLEATMRHGCPEEASKGSASESFWAICVLIGISMGAVGVTIGTYRLLRSIRAAKPNRQPIKK